MTVDGDFIMVTEPQRRLDFKNKHLAVRDDRHAIREKLRVWASIDSWRGAEDRLSESAAPESSFVGELFQFLLGPQLRPGSLVQRRFARLRVSILKQEDSVELNSSQNPKTDWYTQADIANLLF